MILTHPEFQTEIELLNTELPTQYFIFRGNEILLTASAEACWASEEQVQKAQRVVHLGRWGARNLGAISLTEDAPVNAEFKGLRSTFGKWEEGQIALAGRAHQLLEWQRTHQFCGVCGAKCERQAGERAMRCTSCGHSNYPRIAPAMMVLIHKGDQLLLARNINFPVGRMSALAGFLEAGESIEECVHREVQEEVGLKVHNLRYVASQNWPFPHSLMIAFHADYLSGEISTDPHEIAEAKWFGPDDELPQLPPTVSIASHLIADGLRLKHPNRGQAVPRW